MARHKGIGMNKAKKRKPSPLVPAAEVVLEEEEPESEPEPEHEPENEPESEPVPAPAEPAPAEACQPRVNPSARLAKLHKEMRAAEQLVKVAERKWERKKKTYMDSGKYSPYDVQSTVQRIESRLLEADKELGQARATYLRHRDRWVRWRSYCLLSQRYQENPLDDVIFKFWKRAALRVAEFPQVPQWTSMWPGRGADYRDRAARDFGLQFAWGLTHADEIKGVDPDAPDGETEPQRQRRVKAKARSDNEDYIRKCIVRRLQWEKEGKTHRRDRNLLHSYTRDVDVREIWREFGECNCPYHGVETCDLCPTVCRGRACTD